MTDSVPQASREWISTTRVCAEQEDPPSVDEWIIDGVPRDGTRRRARQLDPIHRLGCSSEEAVELFHGRPVTPGEAEGIAAASYSWRRHLHDPKSYWITTAEAARILKLTPRQVKWRLDRGQLQHVRHASQVRLMRRAYVLTLAETWS